MKKVLIIGGGIIGQFSAYYLSKGDNEVIIIDDGPTMTPASEGNCGLITPSHILPLNSFSAILQGIKWLGKKNAPLKIKPQLNLDFIKWFANFIWYSRSVSVKKATLARHELLQQSFKLYETFFQEEPNQSEWRKGGLLNACKNHTSLSELNKEVELHQSFGMASHMLTADELMIKEPLLKEGLAGGAIMEIDRWVQPSKLLEDLKKINLSNGVQYVKGKVESFRQTNSKLISANTENLSIEADEFVLATGALSPVLAKQLNIRIPVIPGKGYNWTSKNGQSISLQQPLYMIEKKVVATPWENSFRVGSTLEFAGYNMDLSKRRLAALLASSSEYLNIELENIEMIPWTGWRPMKDDGIPMIEKKLKNLAIATGHGMIGLSTAPATGYIVNELINGSKA